MTNYDNQMSAVIAQGTSTKNAKKDNQKFTTSELLKKYFVPMVPKGQTSAMFKFRVIPEADATSPFKEVFFHYMKVGNKWQKLLCLKQCNDDCPLCETNQALLANDEKEDAMKYRASVFYVVKGVERGKEHEGIKFWRFRKNFKGKGEFDKILSKFNVYGNILHPENGYDLVIDCALDDKGNSYVRDISCVEKTPLMPTTQESEKFLNDDTTWRDIFRAKEKSFLEDVIYGRAAYWDDNLKKYIRPGQENTADSETTDNTTAGGNASVSKTTNVINEVKKNPLMTETEMEDSLVNDTESDDELPF